MKTLLSDTILMLKSEYPFTAVGQSQIIYTVPAEGPQWRLKYLTLPLDPLAWVKVDGVDVTMATTAQPHKWAFPPGLILRKTLDVLVRVPRMEGPTTEHLQIIIHGDTVEEEPTDTASKVAADIWARFEGLTPRPILCWDFHEAPAALRSLSTQGGDERYLALVPPEQAEYLPRWLDSERFSYSIDEHPLEDGSKVIIGGD